jgi:HlyD family secretion protein
VDNGDLSLRPGMTATAEIVAATRRDVLLIPNAALRFTPPAATAKSKTSMAFTLMPRPPASPKSAKPARNGQGEQRIWVLRDGQPTAVAVKVGVSDGKHSEVMGGELKAGMPVITEILAAKP